MGIQKKHIDSTLPRPNRSWKLFRRISLRLPGGEFVIGIFSVAGKARKSAVSPREPALPGSPGFALPFGRKEEDAGRPSPIPPEATDVASRPTTASEAPAPSRPFVGYDREQ